MKSYYKIVEINSVWYHCKDQPVSQEIRTKKPEMTISWYVGTWHITEVVLLTNEKGWIHH
jgi:hypothetical protein